MLWHRHQLALHHPPGGFLRVGKRRLDRHPIVGGKLVEHLFLLVRLQLLDQRDGVVGIHFGNRFGHLRRRQFANDFVAHPVVHFRQHIGGQVAAQRDGQRTAQILGQLLEQVGDVGRVQRLHQRANLALVIARQRRLHGAQKLRLQPVVGHRFGGFGLAHRRQA